MSDFLPFITGGGGALAVFAVWMGFMLSGKLQTAENFRRMLTDRDTAAAALATERSAHDQTRQALIAANQRADVAVQASQVVAQAMMAAQAHPALRQGNPHVADQAQA